jgi:hypothetical protein
MTAIIQWSRDRQIIGTNLAKLLKNTKEVFAYRLSSLGEVDCLRTAERSGDQCILRVEYFRSSARLLSHGGSLLTPRQAEARDFGPVIGTWEGSLDPINGSGLVASDKPLPIRMVVRDDGAQVFTGENFDVEAKPGKFKVE